MLQFQKYGFIHQVVEIEIIIHAGDNGLVNFFGSVVLVR